MKALVPAILLASVLFAHAAPKDFSKELLLRRDTTAKLSQRIHALGKNLPPAGDGHRVAMTISSECAYMASLLHMAELHGQTVLASLPKEKDRKGEAMKPFRLALGYIEAKARQYSDRASQMMAFIKNPGLLAEARDARKALDEIADWLKPYAK